MEGLAVAENKEVSGREGLDSEVCDVGEIHALGVKNRHFNA